MTNEPINIAPNIWVFPPDAASLQPCVGIIITPAGTILIDGGNSPRHARRISAALNNLEAPPVVHIIYTHHHWDHVFGAAVFQAPVVAHEQCRALVAEMAARPWSAAYVLKMMNQESHRRASFETMYRLIEHWERLHIQIPAITFSHTMRLHVGGVTIELEHVGGQHAVDSIIVRLPESRVMFLGDCFYPRNSFEGAPAAARPFLTEGYDTFVEGHHLPRTRAEFEAVTNQNT